MNKQLIARLTVAFLTTVAAMSATTIDFEAQGSSAPSLFNASLNSPLVIGIATITGGKLLKDQTVSSGPADPTVVYATNGFSAGYTDPLTITFSSPVNNVSLEVTNETPDTYTLADNLGHSDIVAIGSNVDETLSLTDTGVTSVTIETAATVYWDFAIDNVSFTPATSTPEPLTVTPVAGALLGLWFLRRKRGSQSANCRK